MQHRTDTFLLTADSAGPYTWPRVTELPRGGFGLVFWLGLSLACHGAALVVRPRPPHDAAPQAIPSQFVPIDLEEPSWPVAPSLPAAELPTPRALAHVVPASAHTSPPATAPETAPRAEAEPDQECPELAAAVPASPTVEATFPAPAPPPKPVASAPAVARRTPAAEGQNDWLAARQRYLASLRGAIEARKAYPLFARRRRLEGTVVVRFSVSPSGRLADARIARSSGESVLDEAALAAVRSVQGLAIPPAGLAGNVATVEVPLVFRLSHTGEE